MMDVRFSLAGLLVGILVGLTGMGGGSLLAPIMILFFRVPPIWAIGTDITYSTVTKAVGSLVHIRQKQVDLKVAAWLACGSVPATALSIFLVQYIRKHLDTATINALIMQAVGCTLLLVAVLMIAKPSITRRLEKRNFERQKQRILHAEISAAEGRGWRCFSRPLLTALVGASVGFLVGLTSVGSGTLIIVSLFFLFPELTPKQLVGTDVFQAFLMLLSGAVAYFYVGTVNWMIVGLLLIGSLPGVIIGSRLSKYIPDSYLRPVMAVVLAVSGFKMI